MEFLWRNARRYVLIVCLKDLFDFRLFAFILALSAKYLYIIYLCID